MKALTLFPRRVSPTAPLIPVIVPGRLVRKYTAMVKKHLYEPYTVTVETHYDYPERMEQNSFFELIYILSGSGRHLINNSVLNYEPGHMFLVTPQDSHGFNIDTPTEFFFLRFNDVYLKNNVMLKNNIQQLKMLLGNANNRPGCVLRNEADRRLAVNAIQGLIHEQATKDTCWEKITYQLVNTVIVLVARNIRKNLTEDLKAGREDKASDILQYIQANIYNPDNIKAENVSRTFGISLSYLGRYFKKQTGKTMQEYISHYKMRLIENRLQHSKMRISEIVDELGFSDESHLNKFFRKQKGVSPSEFRKKKLVSV
jgi:AraC-like DNA-binding protein